MGISSDGILFWNPKHLGKYVFTIKATDPCGLGEQADFTVNVSQCFCEGKNEGICKWTSDPETTGEVICVCPDGCTGPE